jgi:quinol monooxygenase YgiN
MLSELKRGNLRYQYFQPLDDPETVLLIDSWTDQAAIDKVIIVFVYG